MGIGKEKLAAESKCCRGATTRYDRYNVCACGLYTRIECYTNSRHKRSRDPGCPICETHHKAKCACGSAKTSGKDLRSRFTP